MTHQEFKNRIHALAVGLGANITIENKGMEISQAIVYVGSRIALFVTLNTYFNKIETCNADGEEAEIAEDELEKCIYLTYISAMAKHMQNAVEYFSEEIAK